MTERWADWIAERFVSEPLDAPEIGPGVKTAYVVASAIPVGAAIAVTMYAQEIWEIAHGHTYLTPELPEQSHAATPDAHPAPAPAGTLATCGGCSSRARVCRPARRLGRHERCA